MKTANNLENTNLNQEAEKDVLHSQLAGMWYTSNSNQLGSEIEGYLSAAEREPVEDIIALILPHAGYTYSGKTAAFGIEQIKGKDYDRVIVMGPTHQYPLRNAVSVSDATHYATPLGELPLDREFIAKLKESRLVESRDEVHRNEHSVQIEVPLLQSALDDFKLVPLVCGQMDLGSAKELADHLLDLIDAKTLVVASSDFTHYGPRFGYLPFRKNVPENLKELDLSAFKRIERKDPQAFSNYIAETGATICGKVPITILLSMLPKDCGAELLKYDTSGNITGDFNNSVSYISAAFSGEWKSSGAEASTDKSEQEQDQSDAYLSQEEKQNLLNLARSSLTYYIENGKKPNPEDLGIEISEGMQQTMGAFVTLHENGRLRGCIGEIMPRRELYKAVMDHALNAALHDHRFPRVEESELDQIDFEISALSPPKPVESHEEIEIGKHGVVFQKGRRSAVFLPQVAPEQGWDVEETLNHLAMKAGLQPDGWRDGAQFQVFEAIVFGEE